MSVAIWVRQLAVLGVAFSAVACSRGNPPRGGLIDKSDSFGNCQAATTDDPWSVLKSRPTEFGMDTLVVSGAAPAVVTSVEAVGARNIRLAEVSFVAGDGTGNGFAYGDLRASAYPAAWAARRGMPASLPPLTPASTVVNGPWSRLPEWQVVIGVLPTSDAKASLSALRFTYRVDGHQHQLIGRVHAALSPTANGC